MSAILSGTFAPITEEFDRQFARTIPPAAQHLWTWLRRLGRPESPIEFRLADYIETFDYSLKWARTALKTLVEVGLVAIDLKASGYWFRVRVFQVGQVGKKSSSEENKTSSLGDKTSQKQPSNPHDFVNNNKALAYIQQNPELPPTHPVQNEPEMVPAAVELGQAIDREEVLQEIEQAGIFLNPHLEQIVLTATVQTVKNALAAYQEQRHKGNITKNPAGFFRRAVEKGYKPNGDRPQPRSREATPITEAQREPVRREYGRLGIDPLPVPAAITLPPLRPDDADLSDLLAQIRGYHREFGLSRQEIEGHFQQRYGKGSISRLSEAELADWLQFLQRNEGVFVLRQAVP